MESQVKFIVRIATSDDHKYIAAIIAEMASSAAKRGAKVTPRTFDYVVGKMNDGLSVIAINPENNEWAGFCYLEVWRHEKFVANSGLIVSPQYRGMGISKEIKIKLFDLSRDRFPNAKLFSLTTSPAVMHVNIELGYEAVSYSEIMNDTLFLQGSNSWVNYMDLMNNETVNSHYVAMIFEPQSNVTRLAFSPKRHYLLHKTKSTLKREQPIFLQDI